MSRRLELMGYDSCYFAWSVQLLLGLVFRFGMSVWCFCFGHLSFVLGFFLCWVVVMFDLPLIVLDIAYVVGLYACCFIGWYYSLGLY